MRFSVDEGLSRLVYREFLLEPGLPAEVGLDRLAAAAAALLDCGEQEAIEQLTAAPMLDALSMAQLKSLLVIRDMTLVSRTAADVAAELKEPGASYHQCCRTALCYAVIGRQGHAFSALRAAAAKNDKWARHHFIYGLVLGIGGDRERALWELNMAARYEPYREGQRQIALAQDLMKKGQR